MTSPIVPFFIYGLCTLAGGFASIFLPETLGHPLPDTFEDAARLGRKSFWSLWNRTRLTAEIELQRRLIAVEAPIEESTGQVPVSEDSIMASAPNLPIPEVPYSFADVPCMSMRSYRSMMSMMAIIDDTDLENEEET